MFEALKSAIFQKRGGATVEELRAGEVEIRAALEEARARHAENCERHGEALMSAIAKGDEREQQALRKRLLDSGDRVQELQTALESVAGRIAKRTEQDAAAALAQREREARELCKQREQVAAQAQAQAVALGESWREMWRLQGAILGTVPAKGFRTSRVSEDWRDATRAAVEGQLWIASDGALAPGASGGLVLPEFRRLAVDVPAKVAAQHRQILATERKAASNEVKQAA